MVYFESHPRWTLQAISEAVRKRSLWMEILGGLLILLGVVALCFTVAASIASTFLIGGLLLAAGAGYLAATGAFWARRRGGFALGIVLGCLCVIAGILCFVYPVTSLLAITLTLAIYFIVSGIARIAVTVSERFPGWGWGLLAALVEIGLGVVILASWPAASLVVLGTLLGIQLIISGTNAWMVGSTVRKVLAPRAAEQGAPSGRPATRFQH